MSFENNNIDVETENLMRIRQGINGLLAVAGTLVFLAGMALGVPAKAETAAAPPNFLDQVPQASATNPWSGCWIGAGIGLTNLVESVGGPGGVSVDGQKVSGHGGCRVQAGMFIAGLEASYGHMFGDLNTLGVDNEIAVTGTLGVAALTRTQLYGHLTWARLDTLAGDIDGWKFGPGVAIQIPNSPVEIDFRYSYGVWDVGAFGVDVNSHEFMAVAKYRFGAK